MAQCKFCGKETVGASTCLASRIIIAETGYDPVPFERKTPTRFGKDDPLARCPECNVVDGGYHHVGCGLEICPKCGFRWIMCRCSGSKEKLINRRMIREGKVIPLKATKKQSEIS